MCPSKTVELEAKTHVEKACDKIVAKMQLKKHSRSVENLLAEMHDDPDHCPDYESDGHWLLDHPVFNGIIYSTIVLNSIQMGFAVDFPNMTHVWMIFEHIFTAIFSLEMIVKMAILKSRYFHFGWNRVDFVLVAVSVLELWVLPFLNLGDSDTTNLTIVRVLRICRVARMARLFKVCKELWCIFKGIVDSFRTIFWVCVLLSMGLYVCSIFCVEIIGRDVEGIYPGHDDDSALVESEYDDWNSFVYFGNIPRSMYTLFNVILLAEFETISRPIFEKQPFMTIFLVAFVIFTTFGLLNVIIGVVCDNTLEAAKQLDEDMDLNKKIQQLWEFNKLRDLVFAIDEDHNGVVSDQEIKKAWKDPVFRQLLQDVHFPRGWSPKELACLLDRNGDKEVKFSEFIQTFSRLILNDPFQRDCCTHASINDIRQRIVSLSSDQRDIESATQSQLKSLAEKCSTLQQSQESLEQKMLQSQKSLEDSMQKGFQDMHVLIEKGFQTRQSSNQGTNQHEIANLLKLCSKQLQSRLEMTRSLTAFSPGGSALDLAGTNEKLKTQLDSIQGSIDEWSAASNILPVPASSFPAAGLEQKDSLLETTDKAGIPHQQKTESDENSASSIPQELSKEEQLAEGSSAASCTDEFTLFVDESGAAQPDDPEVMVHESSQE